MSMQVGSRLTLNVWVTPIRRLPLNCWAEPRKPRSPSSISDSASFTLPSNCSPASVITMRLPMRSNSRWPISVSSCLIWCDSVDWVTWTVSAARVKLSCSASAAK